ncbi:Plasmodium exported protein, unknown function [Plasmodium reichenowi]|uniref:Putative exported protein n=1 Tax=Plasmodium reichenowi TaxID=5854 RepID=A0A060RT98_PLARE|nr:putative exported protein [Plasmodium reichenowi]KYO02014.1 putative exported protein [Plasmodium reichenowi]CDO62679.1 Plasmodium exported protein, unknown function [Plasmodium reichenowi]SOV76074.1 Plasmodium exported protein, unknown function [Plasmodium reichenowi]
MIYLRKDKLRFCFYFYVQLFIIYLFIWTENKYNGYGGDKNFNGILDFKRSQRLKEYRILVEYASSYYYDEPQVRIINYDDDTNEEYRSRYNNKNLEESFEKYVDNYEYNMRDNISGNVPLENDSIMDTISIVDFNDENNVEVSFPDDNINEKNINNDNLDELKSYINTNVDENQKKLWNEYINNIDYIKPKSIEYKYKYHTSTKRNLRSFVKYAKAAIQIVCKIIKFILITIYRLIRYIIVWIFNTADNVV